jgi:hypothetical protein
VAGHRKALIVAVDEYEHPGLRRLRSPTADAEALAAVLGDARIGEFEVSVVRNEPAYEIQSRIEDLFADAKADDLLLVHFSGHGLKGEAGDLYFAARNTRPNRLASTAVPADFVQKCVRSSRSRSIVLLLDCCYGGAFSQGVSVRAAGDVRVLDSFAPGKLGGGRGRAVITASNAMEYAFEGEQLTPDSHPTPSLFTSALVQGLASGEADLDEDGLVSLNELYGYVFDRVREQNPNQTPSRDIEMQGELYLAKSGRRRVRPAPLPPDLRVATEDVNPYARLGAVAELRTRLLSDNLPVAAGALEALRAMESADTRLVADAAASAVRELTVHLAPTSLDFGPVVVDGSSSPLHVEVSGPPLARALSVRASEPWIQWAGAPGGYTVSTQPPRAGLLAGTLTFHGPGGEVQITVAVQGQGVETERPRQDPTLSEPRPDLADREPHVPPAAAAPDSPLDHQPQTSREPAPLPVVAAGSQSPTSPSASDLARTFGSTEPHGGTEGLSAAVSPAPTAARRSRGSAWLIVSSILAALVALPTLFVPITVASESYDFPRFPALVVLAGAICVCVRRSRLFGVGLILAGVAVATWWVILSIGLLSTLPSSQKSGWIAQLVLNLLEVLFGVVVGLIVQRSGGLHLANVSYWQGRRRMLTISVLAGGLALLVNAAALGGIDGAWLIVATVWLAALAVGLPLLAVKTMPRQTRKGMLLGWLLSITGTYGSLIWLQNDAQITMAGLILFGLVLFGLSLPVQIISTIRYWREADPEPQPAP